MSGTCDWGCYDEFNFEIEFDEDREHRKECKHPKCKGLVDSDACKEVGVTLACTRGWRLQKHAKRQRSVD
jgi:hypothetical protein